MVEKELPDADTARADVYAVAIKVKEAREKKSFECPKGDDGCIHCRVYEEILKYKDGEEGGVEYIGVGGFNQDVYIVTK